MPSPPEQLTLIAPDPHYKGVRRALSAERKITDAERVRLYEAERNGQVARISELGYTLSLNLSQMDGLDLERFLSKIDRGCGACWIWRGTRTSRGYGQFSLRPYGQPYAHRIAYELWVGDIPVGLQIDHLCRNTSCVNPNHLEAVPPSVNVRRARGTSGI